MVGGDDSGDDDDNDSGDSGDGDDDGDDFYGLGIYFICELWFNIS